MWTGTLLRANTCSINYSGSGSESVSFASGGPCDNHERLLHNVSEFLTSSYFGVFDVTRYIMLTIVPMPIYAALATHAVLLYTGDYARM